MARSQKSLPRFCHLSALAAFLGPWPSFSGEARKPSLIMKYSLPPCQESASLLTRYDQWSGILCAIKRETHQEVLQVRHRVCQPLQLFLLHSPSNQQFISRDSCRQACLWAVRGWALSQDHTLPLHQWAFHDNAFWQACHDARQQLTFCGINVHYQIGLPSKPSAISWRAHASNCSTRVTAGKRQSTLLCGHMQWAKPRTSTIACKCLKTAHQG